MTGRHDRLIQEHKHDPYMSKGKLQEPTVCPECSAAYHKGRWSWDAPEAGANKQLCPACQRIRDRVPAGCLSLGGGFFAQHREDIMNLVRNVEEKEKQAHPLKRVMGVEEGADETLITLTDVPLTRAIGDAIHRAYQGELDAQYTRGGDTLRVTWRR